MEESSQVYDETLSELREKIRTQAQRLRNLEQYKLLCEARIKDFHPSQSFPIKPEEIGSFSSAPLSPQLEFAHEKIKRLEDELHQKHIEVPLAENYKFPHPSTDLSLAQLKELYSAIFFQHHRLLKDKKVAEESLRAEIQYSEEQKTYIEVLKQSIENNSRFSLSDIEENSIKRHIKFQSFDEDLQFRTASAEEERNLDMEKFLADREKTDLFLQDAAEALQIAEVEVQRLEQGNAELRELVEDLRQNERLLVDEIEKARKELGDMRAKENGFSAEVQKIMVEIGELEKKENESRYELEKSKKELAESQHKCEEYVRKAKTVGEALAKVEGEFKKFRENASNEIRSSEINKEGIKNLENKVRETEERNESLAKQYEELARNNKAARSEISSLKMNLENISAEANDLRESLKNKLQKISEFENSSEVYLKRINDLNIKIDKHEHNLSSKENIIKKLKNKIKETEESLENLNLKYEAETKELVEKINQMRMETNKYENKESKLLAEINKCQTLTERLKKELISDKETLENTRSQLSTYSLQNEKLEADLKKSETNLNLEQSSSILLQDENNLLKAKIEDLNIGLQLKISALNQREMEYQKEIQAFNSQCKHLLSKLEEESKLNAQYSEEKCKLQQEVSVLTELRQQLEETKTSVLLFCSNFGSLCSDSITYSSLLSETLKSLIKKYNHSNHVVFLEWNNALCDEIKQILKKLSNSSQDINILSQQLQLNQNKIKILSEKTLKLDDVDRVTRSKIEALEADKERIMIEKEIINVKLMSAISENSHFKSQLNLCREDYKRAQDQISLLEGQIILTKNNLENQILVTRKREDDYFKISEEKSMMNQVLIKLESFISSEKLDMIYSDILSERDTKRLNFSEVNSRELSINQRTKDPRSYSYDFHSASYQFS